MRRASTLLAAALFVAACAPAATPSPTAAPAKPSAPAPAPAASPAAAPATPAAAVNPAIAPLDPSASPAAAPATSSAGATKPNGIPAGKVFSVGVFQLVTHPALDDSRKGALQALADQGFKEGENIKYDIQNAQGDIPTMTTIAQRFRDQNVDLMVVVTTPGMQAAINVTRESGRPPLVFNAVTDPYAAAKDVIRSPTDKPTNVTGIQTLTPVKDAMMLAQKVVPGAKRFGMIWTPAEANSVVSTNLAREAAKDLSIELIEQTVTKSDEVLQAAQSLLTKNIDVFFVSTDSTVVTALESLVKVANENRKPFFANDPASAPRGAAAALGIDYYDQGYESGVMAARILKGESARDIPIERSKKSSLALNLAAARQQGVTFPEDVLQQAAQKFEEIVPAKPKS